MKKLVTLFALTVLVIGGAVVYGKLKPKPPLETKFVQEKRQVISPPAGRAGNKKQEEEVKKVQIKTPGEYALVDNFKHTYQAFNNCGPATLAMILGWYGRNVSQKELGDAMRPYQIASGDNDDKTIFTYEFVDWAKKYGFSAIARINGDIDLLKTFTANGIPVVVKTWLHPNEDIGHFRIVRGFDEEKKVIIQDDSYEGPNRRISYYDFLSMWQPFNYAYIIVYDGSKKDVVEEIIGNEMEERAAWENALARGKKESQLDEENVYPWFNMATSYFHIGDYGNSIASFEKVEARLPKRMLWYQIEPIEAYKELGKYDRVFQITDHILTNGNRAFSELYQLRGEIYLSQGNKAAARKEFDLAMEYNKNFSPAQESLKQISL